MELWSGALYGVCPCLLTALTSLSVWILWIYESGCERGAVICTLVSSREQHISFGEQRNKMINYLL